MQTLGGNGLISIKTNRFRDLRSAPTSKYDNLDGCVLDLARRRSGMLQCLFACLFVCLFMCLLACVCLCVYLFVLLFAQQLIGLGPIKSRCPKFSPGNWQI